MAEQTFRSPGFFEQEIDLTQRVKSPLGTPAGVIGTAEKGPAFVPVTVGSFVDFKTKFGGLSAKRFGPYAVNEFLKNRDAVTYTRVLGAGANESVTDINTTETQGSVRNAGFKIIPDVTDVRLSANTTHILAARHFVSASEQYGYPQFFANDSFNSDSYVNLVRGVIFTNSTTRVGVLSNDLFGSSITRASSNTGADNKATVGVTGGMKDKFKLFISSSVSTFGSDDSQAGVRIMTASLNPRNKDYIRNILNTNPDKFLEEGHLLYSAFDIPTELAPVATTAYAVGMLSGSSSTSSKNAAGQNFTNAFGRFDTRFNAPQTTNFISQPYGDKEFDLFRFEALDDGAYASGKYKVSIKNIRASSDENNPYGTFTVQVRLHDDNDKAVEALEEFAQCDLNPTSERFVGRMIGDRKAFFNFDATSQDERKVIVSGKYSNMSNIVRIVIAPDLANGAAPSSALPFGFRGLEVLKTNDNLNDFDPGHRLGIHTDAETSLSSSIMPPVPFRFKSTNGAVKDSSISYVGQSGDLETVDSRFYWGVKTTQIPSDSTLQDSGILNAALKSNASSEVNMGLKDMLKFSGIKKMDTLVTGSGADTFNNNKFTLARVALSEQAGSSNTGKYLGSEISSTTVDALMLQSAYIRDGYVDPTKYTVSDGTRQNRITFATLLNQTSSVTFNRFTSYMKFTNVLHGGFDGVNILDRDASRMNDKFTSLDTGGGAASAFTSPGLATNMNGVGKNNNGVASFKAAIDIMTDPYAVRTNILSIPGIRETFITDHAMSKNKDYGMSIYLLDIPEYDEDKNRLYDNSSMKPDVSKTIAEHDGRTLDDNASATYFPNVIIQDDETGQNVEVPASVAALAALGFNDRVSYPWYAPAGFNRGSLDFVRNVDVRLTAGDRDALYDARINPIATFPQQGYVIFGQKTLQQAKSALDRVNVRRLLLEVKRVVSQVANGFVFEQNTPALRSKFVADVSPLLAIIQAQSGIEKFKVVMDDTNNSQEDIEANKLNGRIVIVPTRTIEFIALDFIVTNAGVSFE